MGKRRALMLCCRVPLPLTSGYALRAYHIARCLRAEYRVDLLALSDRVVDRPVIQSLRAEFEQVVLFPLRPFPARARAVAFALSQLPLQLPFHASQAAHRWVAQHGSEYDLVLASHIRMAPYARSLSCERVVDLIDALSFFYREASGFASGPWRQIYRLESKRMEEAERDVLQWADKVLVTSGHDARALSVQAGLREEAADERLVVVPNGVRDSLLARANKPASEEPPQSYLVFLGKMDYAPNVDAVKWFCRAVWPNLRERYPKLRFVIVGTQPRRSVRHLARQPGVEVTGWMDDPFARLEAAEALAVPLRFGAGIQNKVLEAMALGVPVVTTSVGVRGIEGEPGRHFRVSEPTDFGASVAALLEAPEEAEQLAAEARRLVECSYRWDQVQELMLDAIR